ncbi:LamG domain-containing protein [Actinocorallia herbida]|nr:LamG domain-containing protein [Actinocorallia herbida]
MVRHDGTAVAFAMDADRRIYYSVLNLDLGSEERGALDVAYWNDDPVPLPFPAEIADCDPRVTEVRTMPVVRKRSRAETRPELLLPGDADPFLSTTARLTADVPIQVVSDGRYLLVFRQSIADGHADAVYRVRGGGLSGDAGRADLELPGGAKSPAVDASLLVDRYVLVGSELKPVVEVRYQRSRDKTVPASGGDTLGTRDMHGEQFFEPTLRLSFAPKLAKGAFCALILPTIVSGASRWQLFAHNAATGRIESFNLDRTSDGLFDLVGTQLYTSPDPRFAGSVLEREQGIDPNTQRPMVPVVAATDRASTALRFAGSSRVLIGAPAKALADTGRYTVEAWVRPAAYGGVILASEKERDTDGFQLSLDAQGKLKAAQDGQTWSLTGTAVVAKDVFSHVAAVFDGTKLELFLNGASQGSLARAAVPKPGGRLVLAARLDTAGAQAQGFSGDIDEVRIWSTARTPTDLADRGRRLTGIESGLVAYYRFDEGAGTSLADQTANLRTASHLGSDPVWVTSDAPVGDGPGLARDTFAIKGRTVVTGLSALLYHQQEPMVTGYGGAPTQEKRQARVLLAFATSGPAPAGGDAARSYVSTVDFAVGTDGRLSAVPDTIDLAPIGLPDPTSGLERISAAQDAVASAQIALDADRALADQEPAMAQRLAEIYFGLYDVRAMYGLPHQGYLYLVAYNQFCIYADWWTRERERLLRAELAVVEPSVANMRAAQQRATTNQAALTAAQNNLSTLSGGMLGDTEPVLPMPVVSSDRSGLSTFGALLTFAWTAETPSLLDSANGDVALYFRGGDGQFFSAYYATSVSRAGKRITLTDGTLELAGRDPAVNTADIKVTVSAGATSDTCKIVVARGTVSETFPGVPRRADLAAAVLSGDLPAGTVIGAVKSVADRTVTLAAPLAGPLAAGTAVRIGDRARTVSAAAASGATTFTVSVGSLDVAAGSEIRTLAYDFALATCTVPGVSLSSGSKIVGASAGKAVAAVPDGVAADAAPALTPRWRGASPGRSLAFTGGQSLALPAASLPKAAADGDLTIEAWARPTATTGRSRILHANGPSSGYGLGLEGTPVSSALSFNGTTGDAVKCATAFALGTGFTIEFWMRPTAVSRTNHAFGHGTENSTSSFVVGLTSANRFTVGDSTSGYLLTSAAYTDQDWHHWAVVQEAGTNKRFIYRDGVKVAEDTPATGYSGTGVIYLGANAFGSAMQGELDEVRVWNRARTQTEIDAYRRRRASGREPGLTAYWNFANLSAADRTGNGNDGRLAAGRVLATSGLTGYRLIGSVGDQYVRSVDAFTAGDWSHLALTFQQAWAMRLDGASYIDCGGADGLDLVDDLTIEANIRVDDIGPVQGLVGKGTFGSGKPGSVPYSLYVNNDGQIGFAFETGSGSKAETRTFLSGTKITAGAFTKVAVTRRTNENRPNDGRSGITEIRFYINGVAANAHDYTGTKPVGNDANAELGRRLVGAAEFGLRGVLSEARIWNTAREAKQIGAAITAKADGLLAWWTFPETEGGTTADACDTYPGRLWGATRTRTPDPAASTFTFYQNGTPSAAVLTAPGDPFAAAGRGADQFTVGAFKKTDGTAAEPFTGEMDELRVWRTARTQEQVLDNLFGRLRGRREDLIAYYPFDGASTTAGALVRDDGLIGNDLTPSTPPPTPVLCTAPISQDIAEVRSALTGIATRFNSLVSAVPAATEYADVQRLPHGGVTGVMKRSYTYVRGGAWHLHTGYKVGDLTTTWVGQAQFDPQLVGYIEGAPPVPSENLIHDGSDDPTQYGESTSVEFVQADSVSNTLSSDHETSVDMSAKAKFTTSVAGDEYMIKMVPPIPIVGVATPVVSWQIDHEVTAELGFSNGWSNGVSVTQGTDTTRSSKVSLAGNYEPAETAKQVNAAAGRRWVPANTGFAVVQSDTADVYALRLEHNQALVAYRMLPSPDIPRDWNLIPFPINPRYTKQGTLDGLIGFGAPKADGTADAFRDPSFPTAGDGGEYSYLRVREAYQLKRRIEREQQQLQGYYDSVSTETGVPDPVQAQADRVRASMTGGPGGAPDAGDRNREAGRRANSAAARRNLANTYVWTAAGGFFAETTGTVDQVTETTGGSYSVNGSLTAGGMYGSSAWAFGFKAGWEVSLGGGYSVTRSKSKDATRSFSLDVSCAPESDLQKTVNGVPQFDANNKPVLTPGRVDAYRFMTFYLDTSKDNFEDFYGKVVDPDWLRTDTSANARALQATRQTAQKPPCWRILHRVTFVSRVLPPVSSNAPASLTKAMLALGMNSHNDLAERLKPYLGADTGTRTALTAALDTAVRANFPTLTPYLEELKTFFTRYYDITT